MTEFMLNAETRELKGKKNAKQLRREGKIPGIYYAHREKSISLTLDRKELIQLVSREIGLIDIKIDKKRAKKCIIKEIQVDPVTHDLLHIDIMGVKLEEKITTTIPIHITGEARGVKEGGSLSQSLHELEISCLPLDIPEHIDIDVTELKVGDAIHVKDIKIDKVDIVTDPEVVIVNVGVTRVALKEEKPVEPSADEEAEAEKGEQEAPKEE